MLVAPGGAENHVKNTKNTPDAQTGMLAGYLGSRNSLAMEAPFSLVPLSMRPGRRSLVLRELRALGMRRDVIRSICSSVSSLVVEL